jgi:hypothetical protein
LFLDEIECADCPIFLADLDLFKENHAFKCEELDVLRVEVAEIKSRPDLLGACTSCLVLHGKFDEMHAHNSSIMALYHVGSRLSGAIPNGPKRIKVLTSSH